MTDNEILEISFLARLLENHICKESKRYLTLIHRYETAGWLMRSSRKHEWKIRQDAISNLSQRLLFLLPAWEQDFALIQENGLDPKNPLDIEALPALKQGFTAKGMINRRTWAAIGGLGPKRKTISQANAVVTHDWIIRFRANRGLTGCWNDGDVNLWEMSSLWTECIVPQRRWLSFQCFMGKLPKKVITCENLGSYIDLDVSDDTLILFAPGNNIDPAVTLLKTLPLNVMWIHFGDLDPEGIEIAKKIAFESGRAERTYIPSFALEYVERAQKKDVEWKATEHPVLDALARHRVGIFQEVFMLDSRLKEDISAFS